MTIPGSYEPRTQPLGAPAAPVSPPGAPQYPPAWPPPPPPRRSRTGLILALILAAVVVAGGAGVIVGLVVHRDSKPDPAQVAIQACESAVRDQLKSPATAQFSSETTTATGSGYEVTGAVDAQNGFGALLRSSWTCGAYPIGGGRWSGTATIRDDD